MNKKLQRKLPGFVLGMTGVALLSYYTVLSSLPQLDRLGIAMAGAFTLFGYAYMDKIENEHRRGAE